MAWETRRRRRYYYRKVRWQGRVRSEYIGRGLRARCAEAAVAERADAGAARRHRRRQLLRRESDIDGQIQDLLDWTRYIVRALSLVAGWHTHKGTWRRRRG